MTISVSQLNNYVHGLFDMDGVLNDLSVCGEIANVKRSRDGWYFSVKDEQASVDCFAYAANCAEPVAGAVATVEGRLNYWVKSGRVSFFVRRLTSTDNTGAAYKKFLELKEKLQKEGLFDESRKKPVPKCCMNIGVVTSATGAVIHDIDEVAHRRQPFSNVILYPVKVQGEGADLEIAQGVLYLSQADVDVVIVGRGGGSNDDLSVFNSEVLVRAVAACDKPVVSAVGHGVDYTLCDFAADRRAVTPSEAAEFVTLDAAKTKRQIISLLNKQAKFASDLVARHRYRVRLCVHGFGDALSRSADSHRRRVNASLRRLSQTVSLRYTAAKTAAEKSVDRLNAANPANILRRGYAALSHGSVRVTSVSQVGAGDSLDIALSDGMIAATVTNKEKK